MNVTEIKNIKDLILLPTNKTIKSYKVKRLTAPGENYGSLMLSLDIQLSTPKGDEKLKTVAKLVPPNEFIQKIFNTQVTFRNEIGFYKKIVPLLQEFQKQHGIEETINFTAKYYGSRLNLKNDDNGIVDADAALVLQNLVVEDYQGLNRLEGLDFDAAVSVLKNLAQFHAVPLAFKLQKPDLFEKEIKPFLAVWTLNDEHNNIKKDQIRVLDKCPELESLRDRILTGFDRAKEGKTQEGPFSTIVHNDCWTNNNMYKLENEKVIDSKLVDFQILNWGSPARDVIFFIFSSIQNQVITDKYDKLLKIYYDTFIENLKNLNCDLSLYSFENFEKELNFEAKYSQFRHIAFMLIPIYAPKENAQDISEMSPESMALQEISNTIINKYVFVCKEFAKRNWI